MEEKKMDIRGKIQEFGKSLAGRKMILIMTVISAIFGWINICIDGLSSSHKILMDTMEKLWLASLFWSLCLFSGSFLTEGFAGKKKYLIQGIIAVTTTGLMYIILQFVKLSSYKYMYFLGILAALLCFTIYIFTPKQNANSYYANLFKYFVFTGLLAFVGFLGSILLIFAFSSLIHELHNISDVIACSAILFFQIFYINIFSFYLFEKREEPSGKAFKIIFMYICLPVYEILLLVLYAYLLKALFIFKLPQGQINWFVSFASVIYMVLYFILGEYRDEKVMKLFYKYGAIILIPLMLVQFPAFFIRVNAYGYTGWRYSSLLFNIFSLIFVIFTFIKKGLFTKYAVPVLGGIILLGSVTPLNLIDVAYNSQYKKLCSVLNKYNMFNGKTLTNYDPSVVEKQISIEDRKVLNGAWHYIVYTSEHIKPDWFGEQDYSFKKLFAIEADAGVFEKSFYFDSNTKEVDISGYSKLKEINLYYYKKFVYEKPIIKDIDYDLTDDLLNLKDRKEPLEILLDENHKAVITSVSYRYSEEESEFSTYNISGYLLEK